VCVCVRDSLSLSFSLSLSLSLCCMCVCVYVTPYLSLSSLHVLPLCVQAEAIRKKRENPQFRQADLERDAEVIAQEGKREKQLFLSQMDELHAQVSLLFLHVCLYFLCRMKPAGVADKSLQMCKMIFHRPPR